MKVSIKGAIFQQNEEYSHHFVSRSQQGERGGGLNLQRRPKGLA
jgi:hypothetical protein